MAKGLLGTKNERLVQFQVAPIRRRSRSVKPEPEPPPPVESVALTEQKAGIEVAVPRGAIVLLA